MSATVATPTPAYDSRARADAAASSDRWTRLLRHVLMKLTRRLARA
jgi:hypothetical protein